MSGCSKTGVIVLQPESSYWRIIHVHSCPLYMYLRGAVLTSFAKVMLLRMYQKRYSHKTIIKEASEDVQTPAANHIFSKKMKSA